MISRYFSALTYFMMILSVEQQCLNIQDNKDVTGPNSTGSRISLPNSAKIIETILNIKTIMKWPTVVVLYDELGQQLLTELHVIIESDYLNIQASFFDVCDWTGREEQLLLMIHENYFPNISIVLIGGKQVLNILNYANRIDSMSNRTTDFRHKGDFLAIPAYEFCVYSILDPTELILENLAIIISYQTDVVVYTLSFDVKKFISVPTITKELLFPNVKYGFNGRHFLIASHVSPQFLVKTVNNGTATYTGYAKTFSDVMSRHLNFTYEFVEPADQKWGDNRNGTWNGLVGQLLRREVDMAVAELTLTPERETVVDFVLPQFFTQGLGMVFRKEDISSKGWLNILQPFQYTVYYTILAAIVGFSILMYIMEKINPLNKQGTCHSESVPTEILSVSNLFISVIGCSFLGSDGLRPISCTGRLLTFALWLFCVVVAATYSGNLTASLTVPSENKPFTNFEEMIVLQDWKWGVHPATLSAVLLQSSNRPDFKKTWEKILEFNKSDPFVLSTSSDEHIRKAEEGNYAYITLDPLLFMLKRNDCLFDTVTNIVQTQHVALAVSENSPYRIEIQRFLFYLFDSGVLELWEQSRYKDNRPRECLVTKTNRAMFLDDIKGAFAALAFGIAIATGILIAEFIFGCISKFRLKRNVNLNGP